MEILIIFKFVPNPGCQAELTGALATMYNMSAEPSFALLDDDELQTLASAYLFMSEIVDSMYDKHIEDFLMPVVDGVMGPFLALKASMEGVEDMRAWASHINWIVGLYLVKGLKEGISLNSLLGKELIASLEVFKIDQNVKSDDFF